MKSKLLRRLLPFSLMLTALMAQACGHQPQLLKAKGHPRSPQAMKSMQAAPQSTTSRQLIVKRRPGVRLISSLPAWYQQQGVKVNRRISRLGVEVLELPANASASALLQQLKSDPGVAYAEVNRLRHISLDVNDPQTQQQYALTKLEATRAWDVTMGRADVIVAIVDTGIDLEHPDLKSQLVPGFSAIPEHPSPADDNGHGTHVAGIVAAAANNQTGIAGLAPGARVMPIKVLSKEGFGDDAGIAEGIIWAADHGADIINMSLGGEGTSKTLEEAINYALQRQIPVIAAMGNDGGEITNYPAAQPGVIAVGSTDQEDARSNFSNMGQWIQVSAPGSAILSTFPTYEVALNDWGYTKNYAVMDGTSMATPYVAGLVALLKSQLDPLTPEQALARLKQGAQDMGAPGFDAEFGFGRVNAFKSLTVLRNNRAR